MLKEVVMAWFRGQPRNLPTVNRWMQEISIWIARVAADIWTMHLADVMGCGINFTPGSWAVMLTLGCIWQTCICDCLWSKHSKEYESISTLFTALLNRHTLEKCTPVKYMHMWRKYVYVIVSRASIQKSMKLYRHYLQHC